MKRILSLILCFAMVLTMMPVQVFAEGTEISEPVTPVETTAPAETSAPVETAAPGCDVVGHQWEAATCTVPKTCTACGATEGDALGHSYVGQVTVSATCTVPGVKTFTCGTCRDAYTEAVAAKGHSLVYTDLKDGSHSITCGDCKEVLTASEPHAYNDAYKCVCNDVQKFTVTFTVNGLPYGQVQTVAVGAVITVPGYEVPVGHTFSGWTVPETMPAENLTLDASLTVNKYDVTFTINGEVYKKLSFDYGTAVTAPEYTVPVGYSFPGWAPPETMPAENITLDASLTANSYDAVFDANGSAWEDGDGKKRVPTDFDAEIAKPADPVRAGYTFTGWAPEVGIMDDVNGKIFTAQWQCNHDSTRTEDKGNGTHDIICTNSACNAVTGTERHAYDDQTRLCICGKEEPAGYGYTDNLYWELDAAGRMTLIGEGTIENGASWADYASQVKELVIDDRITAIGAYAFGGFTAMEKLSFPGTAALEDNAFGGCGVLEEITVTGQGAMGSYDVLTSRRLPWFASSQSGLRVTVAEGITAIGDYAFCQAENLAAVVLPDTLTSIGASAFRASGLRALTIPENVAQIGEYALSELEHMEELVLPDSAVSLGAYALSGSGFRRVVLPRNLTAISEGLLSGCEKLDAVAIPEGVTAIGPSAFKGCRALLSINIPAGVTRIEANTFQDCGLYSVFLPEGLAYVGAYAFSGNGYLTKLTIPAKVLELGEGAFSGCALLDTLILQSVSLTVRANAFSGCGKLKMVHFGGTEEQWNALTIETGNDALTNAGRKYKEDSSYNPVQQVNILHKAGLESLGIAADEVLNSRQLLVDLKDIEKITLGYAVLPADATNAEIIWFSPESGMTDSAYDETGNLVLTGMQPGDMTLNAQNYVADSKDPYSYAISSLRLQFRRLVIAGDLRGYLPADRLTQLTAKILGEEGLNRGILWRVENLDGEASVDSKGVLTPLKTGRIRVFAMAADGSGLDAELVLEISDYAVVVEGPAQVTAGKSITLSARLTYEGDLADIRWKLKEESDQQYVSLSSTGKLTAKKGVTKATPVTVVAYTIDGLAQGELTVTVVPVVTSVAICRGEETVTGQTLKLDLNADETPITLRAETAPGDASGKVTWKVSDSKGTVSYEPGDDSITLTPTGKTGTVTLTATAADGSGKKATVKLQFVRLAKGIAIDDPGVVRAGSKVTLTSSVATEAGLTDRNVVWALDDASLPYASITAKGVLTAYAFPNPVTVTVYATVQANGLTARREIQIVPGATAAQISRGGEIFAKGQTLYAALGEAVTLRGTGVPAYEGHKPGTWKVSGKGAALTDNGDGTATVTMAGAGTATVTFTTGDGSKKSTSVKVQFVNWGTEMTVTAPKGQTELVSGSKLQLTAAVTGVKVKNFLWYVDKPEAATVSKGKVTALKVYENTPITVTAIADDGSGLKATFDILIKPSKTETLHIKLGDQVITGSTQYMRVGDTRELSVWVYDPDEGSWKTVDGMLELSGKGVKQEGSTFTATAVGKKTDKATVTAKYGKLKAAITLKVVNPAESITLSEKKDTFHTVPGKSLNFTAKIQGEGGAAATMDTVIWSVDNTAAATISAKGVLKAAKTVTEKTVVKVTATAADGFGASTTREVTIYPMATAILVHVQKVDEEGQPMGSVQTLNQCIREFRVGDRLALDADVFPQGAMDAVSWDIGKSKNAMLTTGEDGTPVITLLKKGTLTIKACLQDGSGGKVTVKIKIVE